VGRRTLADPNDRHLPWDQLASVNSTDTLEIAYLLNTGMLVWHAETAQDFFD
jgi:hypothetical protein